MNNLTKFYVFCFFLLGFGMLLLFFKDGNSFVTCKFTGKLPVNIFSDTAQTKEILLVYDSTEKVLPSKPIYILDSVFVPIAFVVDTAEVIRRYLTDYFYQDSFRNNEISLVVSDSLYNNKLTWRDYRYKILRPDSLITIETIITNTLEPNHFYWGAGIVSIGTQVGLMPKILFTKKQYAFDFGSIINLPQPNFGISIFYKIR